MMCRRSYPQPYCLPLQRRQMQSLMQQQLLIRLRPSRNILLQIPPQHQLSAVSSRTSLRLQSSPLCLHRSHRLLCSLQLLPTPYLITTLCLPPTTSLSANSPLHCTASEHRWKQTPITTKSLKQRLHLCLSRCLLPSLLRSLPTLPPLLLQMTKNPHSNII